jgi:hypothetical protein
MQDPEPKPLIFPDQIPIHRVLTSSIRPRSLRCGRSSL